MTRYRRIGIVSVLAAAATLTCILFVPLSFEKHAAFSIPVYCRGELVDDYGVSRIHSQTFMNYGDHSGDVLDGRCYVTVRRNSQREVYYGWQLRRTASADKSRVELEIR